MPKYVLYASHTLADVVKEYFFVLVMINSSQTWQNAFAGYFSMPSVANASTNNDLSALGQLEVN